LSALNLTDETTRKFIREELEAFAQKTTSPSPLSGPEQLRTFFLTNPDPADPRIADRAHFLASVLYPYEEGRYSWADRHVDLRSWLNCEPVTDASAWGLDKLRIVLDGFNE
jgi:hypothetical protein